MTDLAVMDVTELFLDDGGPAAAPDGDGLVWKTVCRTGQWRLSPIPGGKPLVIDKALFDDVKRGFDQGAWEHVTVPLSHKDRVDENTGYVKALTVEPDAKREGEYVLRAGMKFTDPAIREKVTNGSIANTSVGIALTGHTRTSDGKHFPRVLKHVALTNQPWLDGLEPFGDQIAAAQEQADGEPLVYLLDWDPAEHPKWPEGSPGGVGGRFMRIGELLDQISHAGHNLDVSWLAKGADHITHVEASDVSTTNRKGEITKIAHFDVTLDSGAKHTFDVTEGGLRDGSLIQGALRQIDHLTGGATKVYGIGDQRIGQPRPAIDPLLEHVLHEAEQDPTTHPPLKPGRTTRKLLGVKKRGGRAVPESGFHGNTQQMWTTGGTIDPRTGEVTGDYKWSSQRKQLHNVIVDLFLRERKPNGDFNPKGKRLKPPADGNPIALFFAGGTASGKSTALKDHGDAQPPGAVVVDPDEIKKFLPEFRDATLARDKYASSAAHEESSAIAKRIQLEAQRLGLNIIIDGTGDSGQGKFEDKILTAGTGITHKGGKPVGEKAFNPYEVHVFMVDAPTDVAVARSIIRAQKTGRFVGTEITRSIHSSVADRHHEWRTNPIVKSWVLYSTDTPKGGPRSILMASGGNGKFEVHDAARYGEMLGKAGRRSADSGGDVVGQNAGRRGGDSAFSDRTETHIGGGTVVQRFNSGGGRVTTSEGESYLKVGSGGEWKRESGGGARSLDKHSPGPGDLDKMLAKGAEPKAAAPAAKGDRPVLKIVPNPPGGSQRTSVKLGDGTEVQRFSSGGGRVVLPNGESYYREKGDGAWQREVGDHGARSLDRGDPSAAELERLVAQGKAPDVRSQSQREGDTLLEHHLQTMRAAFHDWKSGRAYLDKRGFYKLRPEGRTTGGGGRKAPWSDVVKRFYPDNVEFHRAAQTGTLPDLQRSPIAPGGIIRAPRPRTPVVDAKFTPGTGVQFELGGRFLKGTVVGSHPSGGIRVRVGDTEHLVPPAALHQLAASITIEASDALMLATWASGLHPRGVRGRFVRKLLEAVGNTLVKDVGESGHTLRVGLHTGSVFHVEPISPSKVRVIRSIGGQHVRTSVHAIGDLTTDHPELRGLEGLIKSKARSATGGRHSIRRAGVSRGIKTLVHYGGSAVNASHDGGGDIHMADGDGEGDTTLTLTQEQFQEAVHAAVEAEREADRLELSRSRGEVRELRVERRIAKLQEQGHAPALLKIAEQIMLADETDEPVLTLSQEDGSDKPLTATMIVEELLAAVPETALTASQPVIPGRADGDGGEKPEDSEAFNKGIEDTWSAMREDGRHLVG